MGKETGIAWTDHTFNIAWGCHKVSPGCDHCYAETFSKRTGHAIWGPPKDTERRTFGEKHWAGPLKWNAAAERDGVRRRVFSNSMADLFEAHPTIDAEREKLWPLIHATPWLDWLLLTKRIERARKHLPADWGKGYPNVWLGTSIESGAYLGRLWHLLAIPAKVRFLSLEPLLEHFTLGLDLLMQDPEYGEARAEGAGRVAWPDWVIVGGESGPNHREMPMDGLMSLVNESRLGGAAVFVKQDSGPKPGRQGRIPDDYWIQEFPTI